MITLSKLAKMANVSISTASKAFSMSREIGEETRKMIFDIAKREGVFKKFYNAKYQKLVIAIIVSEYDSRYYASELTALETALHDMGCECSVAAYDFNAKKDRELFEYYSNYTEVDGIITFGNSYDPEAGVPCVKIGNPTNKDLKNCAFIYSTSEKAVQDGIDKLISSGVKRIGYIGEPLTHARRILFEKALQQRGITPDERFIIDDGERFERGGYNAMKQLLQRNEIPDGIYCAYDHMAIGAMRAINEAGLKIPEDIRLFGNDDISESEYLNPPLASVQLKGKIIAETAAKTIIDMILGAPYNKETRFEAEFISRRSVE